MTTVLATAALLIIAANGLLFVVLLCTRTRQDVRDQAVDAGEVTEHGERF